MHGVLVWRLSGGGSIIVAAMDGVSKLIVLQTERMSLSPCCPTDRDDFMSLELDPEVMRFFNGGNAVNHKLDHKDATFLMPRGTEDYVWTERWKTDSAFIGWFCLWPESETVGELGYRLRKIYWGQGLASEGSAALVNWGFRSDRYDRIFASTMAVNVASRRVMEKIGLRYTGAIQVDWPDAFPGSEHGEVQYELMRSDWRGGNDSSSTA
jgi:RimJ/RimL family protein N-acetyltransferase